MSFSIHPWLRWSHLPIALLISSGVLSPCAASASQVVPLTVTETMRQADTIVVGTIVNQKTRWGNELRRWMVTDYTFAVEDAIYVSEKTGAIGKMITVTYWGGTLDGETQAVSDTRLPVHGERLMLMLKAGWQKEVHFSPVVGLNQGLFPVVSEAPKRQPMVHDATGSPLVRADDGTVVKKTPGHPARSTGAAVELDAFVSWIRTNIKAIKAAPSELPPQADRNDPRAIKVVSKKPAPPQPAEIDANQSEPQARAPAIDLSDRGVAAPNLPAPALPAGAADVSDAEVSEQPAPSRMPPIVNSPTYSYPRVAKLPIVVNNFPDNFAPWSPEDEYQMSKWNYYGDVFRVFATPTGTWAWKNNRFDLCGWPSSADMQAQFGAGWDANTIGICYTRWFTSDNKIIEGDIALNPDFTFTLDDQWIYDGSPAQGFRQVMTHELGHMWGLSHQFDFLSVMNYMPDEFRFFGMPYMDDAEGIRAAYPSVAVNRTDLGVYLYRGSGYQSVTDATFPSNVATGGTLTVNNYHVENVGTATIAQPTIEWYLTSKRSFSAAYYFLGRSTYNSLSRFHYFTPSSVARIFRVPNNVAAGRYYLSAFIRSDNGASQSSFPFGNNNAFSRTTIHVGLARSDFNGDGQADILWQSTSGARALWLMNGSAYIKSVSLGTVPPSWDIVGSGDFNGDGQADILWQSTSGARAIWLMNGTAYSKSVALGTVATSWNIVGSGDFNDDGQADILWQSTSGARALWLMNGTAYSKSVALGTVATSWNIVGSGDFNDDGQADILWQSTSGARSLWLMNGSAYIKSVSLGTVPPSWDIRNF